MQIVLKLKTAYKDDALGKTQVCEWISRFKSGDNSRPYTSRTDEIMLKFLKKC